VIDATMARQAELEEARRSPGRRPSKVDSLRPTYGFDDVSLAPGVETVEPADVDTSVRIGGIELRIPILASAMDAVVDARSAGELARLGGLAVLNLEGVQTRFDDPTPVLRSIATAPAEAIQQVLADAYAQPIREDLVAKRIAEFHEAGSLPRWPRRPPRAQVRPVLCRHGAELFMRAVAVSVGTNWPTGYEPLSRRRVPAFHMPIPVAVVNTTSSTRRTS
jgi:IMP dehydrogenase